MHEGGSRTSSTKPLAARAQKFLELHERLLCVADAGAEEALLARLALPQNTRPELIILAMGMPKQEAIAVRLRAYLKSPALIVNGGAILDFLGGKVTRAPRWMQRLYLEWVYRLYLEPRRLARRYLLGIPTYFYH